MPLNLRNEAVNRLAHRLATPRHLTKIDAVKLALENELRRTEAKLPLREPLEIRKNEFGNGRRPDLRPTKL